MAVYLSGFRSIISTFSRLSRLANRVGKLQQIPGKPVYKVVSGSECLINTRQSWVAQLTLRFREILSLRFVTSFQSSPTQRILSSITMEPPEAVRGITVLDKSKFSKSVLIPSLRVPIKHVGKLHKVLSKCMLKVVRLKALAELGDDDPEKNTKKLCLFNPDKYHKYEDLAESDRKILQESGVSGTEFQMFSVELTYNNWSVQDTLRAILPPELDGVTGFSTIGHIAHLNLRAETFPYKHIIGEVILDKTHQIRTVVNKLDIIDNTFRNLRMELLAGEDNYTTQARENGCIYEFDFSKVYWNPRLSTEHERVIKQLKKNDIVYDMFAGVGPFAIPAGKRGIIIHANDLNPDSYMSLQKNITLNKIKDGVVTAYNLDGREFIQTVMRADLITRLNSEDPVLGECHVLMNLPASAVEFLDCFVGLLAGSGVSNIDEVKLPMVHCYCFSKGDDREKDVQDQGETILGVPIRSDVSVRFVRDVSPNKNMMCLSFRLTKDILLKGDMSEHLDELCMPEAKRLKTC